MNHGVSLSRLAGHISISVTLDCLRMFLKMIHKKEGVFRGLNHNEEHVPPSVIMWGTSLSCLNLFGFFSPRLLHLRRTDTMLLFWSSLSTWLFVQRSRKMHPVHVPSNWQGAPARKQEGSYTCKIQAEIRVEHGESLQEAVVTFHMTSLQNASGSIWLRSGNQSSTLFETVCWCCSC